MIQHKKRFRFSRIMEWLIYGWIILLPWQTRWIISSGELRGGYWEYGAMSIYASEVLLWLIILLFLIEHIFSPERNLYKTGENNKKTVVIVLITFFILGFFSLYWSYDQKLSAYNLWKLSGGLVLALILTHRTIPRERIMLAMMISGIIVAAVGIGQFFLQEISANTWLGLASHLPQNLGDSVIETESSRFLRLYGPLPHPNIAASILGLGLIFSLYFVIFGNRNARNSFLQVWFLWGSWIILLSAFLLTMSRAAWVAAILSSIIVFLLHALNTKEPFIFFQKSIPIALVTLLVGTLWYLQLPDLFQTRFKGEERLEVRSVKERVEGYSEFITIFKNHWLEGVGLGNYTLALNKEIDQRRESFEYQPVHNAYLVMTGELGVFSLFLIASLLWHIFKTQFRKKWMIEDKITLTLMSAGVFIVVLGMFDHFLWTTTFGILLWWLIIGLAQKQVEPYNEHI